MRDDRSCEVAEHRCVFVDEVPLTWSAAALTSTDRAVVPSARRSRPSALLSTATEGPVVRVRLGADGMPTILYTRIAGENWNMGQVAIARGTADSLDWTTGVDNIVIDGPPAELKVKAVRDPYVWKANDGWKLILGAALPDDTAAALQYHSADLQHWSYDGIVCSRSGAETEGTWTGTLWECPQLFALGDDWVLLVSVWHDDNLNYVAAAIGDHDGARFRPRRWQRLTYGSSAYAMSTFVDANGQRCVLSWLREEPQNNSELGGFAGAGRCSSRVDRLG